MRAFPPVRIRLTDPDDVAKYGGDWFTYDELAILRTPTGELIEIEQTVGSVKRVMARLREDYTDATRAAFWIARRLGGVVEDFDSFDPLVHIAEWDWAAAVDAAADADPPPGGSSTTQAPPE